MELILYSVGGGERENQTLPRYTHTQSKITVVLSAKNESYDGSGLGRLSRGSDLEEEGLAREEG